MTILDWQRAVLRPRITDRQRIRTLAALRATASSELLTDSTWRRLVASYLRAAGDEATITEWLAKIDRAAAVMSRRKTIRAQRRPAGPAVNQELVRIGGETVCAIPQVARLFDNAVIARVYNPANDGKPVPLPNGRTGLLRVSRYPLPAGRWLAALRGKPWRSPELKLARMLFHLERHGIPAPKLLAYGQTVPQFAPAGSFVLYEPSCPARVPPAGNVPARSVSDGRTDTRRLRSGVVSLHASPHEVTAAEPLRLEHEHAAFAILDRLHQAECGLSDLGPAGEPFAVAGGHIVIDDPSCLRLSRRLGRKQMERDRSRLRAFFRGLA